MPHILLKKHQDIDPCEINDQIDSKFNFLATSQYDQKIGVVLNNKEFLLTKVIKNGDSLIKLDIPTRLTPVSIMKKALNDYAFAVDEEPIFSNTHSIYNKVEPEQSYLKTITYFIDDFQTDKDIFIEVGFGSGKHLLHQAISNPDKIIIGLEIHTPSIEQVLKQAKLQNITNILIINYDARLFLEFLKSNSVSKIFVHFPVPWDKKPHRRVMSIPFIEESLRVLKIDGTLELRTDSPNYYEYNLELLENFKEYPTSIDENKDLEVVSKYEARWKKQQKTIWDITYRSIKNSPPLNIEGDFNFDDNYDIDYIKQNLKTAAFKGDDFIVHLETIYDVKFCDNDGLLIKVTLGSFNRPTTKYIIIQNNKARYFQYDPIKTKTNLKAHQYIKKSLK